MLARLEENPTPTTGKQAALLPVGWKGAIFQVSALVSGSVVSGDDRSGNGYDLSDAALRDLPDLIPNQASLFTAPMGGESVTRLTRAATPALQLLGDMTLMVRVATFSAWPVVTYGFVVSCQNYADGTEAGNAPWSILVHPTAGLRYFCQSGPAKTGVVFSSTSALLPANGRWSVISVRRNAATGVVRLGCNKTYESSGALALPTGGSTAQIGTSSAFTAGDADVFYGQLADINLIPSNLSDSDVDDGTNIMLGL